LDAGLRSQKTADSRESLSLGTGCTIHSENSSDPPVWKICAEIEAAPKHPTPNWGPNSEYNWNPDSWPSIQPLNHSTTEAVDWLESRKMDRIQRF